VAVAAPAPDAGRRNVRDGNVEGKGKTPWNWFMAAALLAMAPCLLVFLAAQRWFIQGAVLTGIKG
jgi:ABC-type glycerol-3-phosphate transport system permease component